MSSLLGPNILLLTLFSDTLKLCLAAAHPRFKVRWALMNLLDLLFDSELMWKGEQMQTRGLNLTSSKKQTFRIQSRRE
jgi:hypothetical protein